MFSGIVETAAKVAAIKKNGGNIDITLECPFADELKIDQSVAHNGVCLTVVDLPGNGTYTVTAIQETLDRSNLGLLKPGDLVNLERSMMMNGRWTDTSFRDMSTRLQCAPAYRTLTEAAITPSNTM